MAKEKKERRRLGDRKDGKLIKDLDPMHVITPVLYPNRCDNEAYFLERFDMAPIREYLSKLNQNETDFPYTPFHILVTAALKLVTLRPKMNRFVTNRLMYQRNEVTASFVVKKLFHDDGAEALALVKADPDDNIFTIHQKLYEQISTGRSDQIDRSSESMDIVSRMPRRMTRAFCHFICLLDKIGKVPNVLIGTDPYYQSIVLSNLGSLKLNTGYHHLTNWGTCSIFVIMGEIKNTPYSREDGTIGYKETMDVGFTIDERMADGYYYAKSLQILRKILANPELMEAPMNTEVKL